MCLFPRRSCCNQAGPNTLDRRTVVGLSAKGTFVFDGICGCTTSLTSCTWVDNCDDGGYVSRACLHVAAASIFPFFRLLPNQLLHTWENPTTAMGGPPHRTLWGRIACRDRGGAADIYNSDIMSTTSTMHDSSLASWTLSHFPILSQEANEAPCGS
jgi:hypothetical protein